MIKTLEESRAFFAADRFAMEACGISIDEVTQDGARCSMPLTPMHLNAGGVAQGGAVYTLCDTTFAVAANAGGVLTVSQCADMHYLRPGAGERLYARRAASARDGPPASTAWRSPTAREGWWRYAWSQDFARRL